MGITGNHAKYLIRQKNQGIPFDKVLMLGRQQLFVRENEWQSLTDLLGQKGQTRPLEGTYAEAFFEQLGASNVDSMDYSDFEKATIIHDLNTPVPDALRERFSVVFDGGTLEHVFNYPIAIKNCMDMLKVGGHFISISPSNNFSGHGFYQFSPELASSVFSMQHGFNIKSLMVLVEPLSHGCEWYEVKQPKDVQSRVLLENAHPVSLLTVAEKLRSTNEITLRPMQSDYDHIWKVYDAVTKNNPVEGESKFLHLYRRFTPDFIKKAVRESRDNNRNKSEIVGLLGTVNPDFFKKVDV